MFEFGKSLWGRKRPLMVAVVVLGLLAIGGGAALVNAGSTPTTIYACVSTKNGAVTIIDATTTCGKNQYPLSWQSGTSSPPPAPTIITRYTQQQGFQAIGTAQYQTIASVQVTVPDVTTITATASGTLQLTAAGAADCRIETDSLVNGSQVWDSQSGSAGLDAPSNISTVASLNVSADTYTVNFQCIMESVGVTTGSITTAQLLVQAVPTN